MQNLSSSIAHELSWTVSFVADDGTEYETEFSGNGSLLNDDGMLNQTLKITDGCYNVEFNTTTNVVGWFQLHLELENELISLGKQNIKTQNDNVVYFYFCTNFFAFFNDGDNDDNSGGSITIESNNYEAIITFTSYDESQTFYQNYFSHINGSDTSNYNTFYITDGCYKTVFNVRYDIYGYDYSYTFSLEINNISHYIIGPNSTDGYYEAYFCTNGTYNDLKHADCSGDNMYNTTSFTFEIDIDVFPEDVSWRLHDRSTNDVVFSGNGSSLKQYQRFYQSECINTGTCYA